MHRPLLVPILVSLATVAQADTPRRAAAVDGESLEVVTFSRASTRLDAAAQDRAEQIAAWHQKHPDSILIIDGYTTREGSWNENLRISQDRTDAVREALVDAGADPSRIVLVAHGDDPGGGSRRITGRVVVRANSDFTELAREQRDTQVGEDARAARRTMNDVRGGEPGVGGRTLGEQTGEQIEPGAGAGLGRTAAPGGGSTIVIVTGGASGTTGGR